MSVRDRIKLFDTCNTVVKPNFDTKRVSSRGGTPSPPSSPGGQSSFSPVRQPDSDMKEHPRSPVVDPMPKIHESQEAHTSRLSARHNISSHLIEELMELNQESGGLDHSLLLQKPIFPKPAVCR